MKSVATDNYDFKTLGLLEIAYRTNVLPAVENGYDAAVVFANHIENAVVAEAQFVDAK